MKNKLIRPSFIILFHAETLMLLLCPAMAGGQSEQLAGRDISMTLIHCKDKSSVRLASDNAELMTRKVTVDENENIQQMLTSNGILADGESIGILYLLNPGIDPRSITHGTEIILPVIKLKNKEASGPRDNCLVALTLDRKAKQDLLNTIKRLDVAAAGITGLSSKSFSSPEAKDTFAVLTKSISENLGTFKILLRERTRPLCLETIQQMNDEAEQMISILDKIAHETEYKVAANEIRSVGLIAKNMSVRMKSLDESKGSGGIPSRWPEVRVSIRVVNTVDGNEVKNLRVYYVAQGLWNNRNKYERSFDKLSSPSERDLPEADYFIWAGKPQDSAPLSDRKSVEIRRKAENEKIELDLTIK
jgi:hypothetical protein